MDHDQDDSAPNQAMVQRVADIPLPVLPELPNLPPPIYANVFDEHHQRLTNGFKTSAGTLYHVIRKLDNQFSHQNQSPGAAWICNRSPFVTRPPEIVEGMSLIILLSINDEIKSGILDGTISQNLQLLPHQSRKISPPANPGRPTAETRPRRPCVYAIQHVNNEGFAPTKTEYQIIIDSLTGIVGDQALRDQVLSSSPVKSELEKWIK